MKNNTIFFIDKNCIDEDLMKQLGNQIIKHDDIINLFAINDFDEQSNIVKKNHFLFSQFSKMLNVILTNKYVVGGNIFVIGDILDSEMLFMWNSKTYEFNMNCTVVTDNLNKHEVQIKKYCKNIITIDEFKENINKKIDDFMIDVSKYNKIYFFGDLQGCYAPIEQFFKENQIRNDELYVFLGDYIDRGIQNDLTVNFIRRTVDLDNFIYLKGNHDEYIKNYGLGQEYDSSPNIFIEETLPQLRPILSRTEALELYNKFHDWVVLKYHDSKILLTHAGLAHVPVKPILLTRKMCIKGYGKYITEIDKIFCENEKEWIQIHGHRNPNSISCQQFKNSFNLEGKVEFGDCLRVIKLYHDNGKNTFETVLIKNNIFSVGLLKTKEPKFKIKNNTNLDDTYHNILIKEEQHIGINIDLYNYVSLPANVYKQHIFKDLIIVFYSNKEKKVKYLHFGKQSIGNIENILKEKLTQNELDIFKRYSAKYNINFVLDYDRKKQIFSLVSARANNDNREKVSCKELKEFHKLFTNIEYIQPTIILRENYDLRKFIEKFEKYKFHYSIIDGNHNLLVLNKDLKK